MEDRLLKTYLGKFVSCNIKGFSGNCGFLLYFDSTNILIGKILYPRNKIRMIYPRIMGMSASEELKFINQWNEFSLRGELSKFMLNERDSYDDYDQKYEHDDCVYYQNDTKPNRYRKLLHYPTIYKWLYDQLIPSGNLMEGVKIVDDGINGLLHPELVFSSLEPGGPKEIVCEEKYAQERQPMGLIDVKDDEDLPETLRHRK